MEEYFNGVFQRIKFKGLLGKENPRGVPSDPGTEGIACDAWRSAPSVVGLVSEGAIGILRYETTQGFASVDAK